MKRLLKLFFAVLAAAMISSCEKGSGALNGTTWTSDIGYGIESRLIFGKTEVENEFYGMGGLLESVKYYYEYSYPEVYMTAKEYGKADLKGVVNSNSMTVTNTSNGRVIGIYIKQ